MQRRALLQRAGVIGAFALAGCGSSGAESPEPGNGTQTAGDDDTPSATPSADERAVSETTVRTVGTDCRSDEKPGASVSFPNGEAVAFSGQLTAPNPCHEVAIESASYDPGADRLSVVLGAASGDQTCIQCVGVIRFEGTIAFTGGLPSAVRISDGEDVLASVDRNGGSGASDSDAIAETGFAVVGRNGRTDVPRVDVSFETGDDRVVVEGTIRGRNGCQTAELSRVGYDPRADEMTLSVATIDRPGTETEACSQQLVGISYRATAEFADSVPRSVAVVHDGEDVVAATYDSNAGTGADGG